MNILIAAGTTLDSSVAKQFGHASYYLYVDADARQVQVIENTEHNDETHAIIPQMVQQGADIFISL
jgi:predicted Fe-Mo cluster-binding NifX family protein